MGFILGAFLFQVPNCQWMMSLSIDIINTGLAFGHYVLVLFPLNVDEPCVQSFHTNIVTILPGC